MISGRVMRLLLIGLIGASSLSAQDSPFSLKVDVSREDNRIYDPKVDGLAFRKTLQHVKRANAPFHFVGLGADPQRGGARIKELAGISGGHAYFPERIEEIVPLYDQISRELGISYTLGYVSNRPAHESSYRKIDITVAGKDYRVSQSRAGYSAN